MSSSCLSSTVYSKHCHPRLKWHLRFRFPALLCCFRLAASSKDLHRKWPKTRPGPDELHPLDRTRGLRRTRFVGSRHATLGLSVLLPGSRIGFINPTRRNFTCPGRSRFSCICPCKPFWQDSQDSAGLLALHARLSADPYIVDQGLLGLWRALPWFTPDPADSEPYNKLNSCYVNGFGYLIWLQL